MEAQRIFGQHAHSKTPKIIKKVNKMPRTLINPPLRFSFDQAFDFIQSMENQRTPELETTGGVVFFAEAATTEDGRRFIKLPHNNRIYEIDWGYSSNHMGNDGQRISQYSIPICNWLSSR